MTEYEKMIRGELYDATDKKLEKMRFDCREILDLYNNKLAGNIKEKNLLLNKLTQKKLKNVFIQAPFYCDYGINLEFGENVFLNFNCVILDCARVKIGENTFLGPSVQIYTPVHPLNAKKRATWVEYAKPVVIGQNCWLGGGVIVLPGVSIGNNTVIGAGSIVVKDIPDNSVAVGNPCKVVKNLI